MMVGHAEADTIPNERRALPVGDDGAVEDNARSVQRRRRFRTVGRMKTMRAARRSRTQEKEVADRQRPEDHFNTEI